MGFGEATASNEKRPAMVFSLWHDESMVVDK
jgi:hypothetical protein